MVVDDDHSGGADGGQEWLSRQVADGSSRHSEGSSRALLACLDCLLACLLACSLGPKHVSIDGSCHQKLGRKNWKHQHL